MLKEATITTIITWGKTIGYFFAAVSFDYLNIPAEQMKILGILMVLDFITGVSKVWRVNPLLLTSHTAWLGVMKKFMVIIVIYAIALMAVGVHMPIEEFMSWSLGILITAETYSIVQNAYAFRTGKILPEYDALSIVLKNIGDVIKGMLEKAFKPDKTK